MRKFAVFLAVLILAALPGSLYINGVVMEKRFRGVVDHINTESAAIGSDLRVEIKTYERGLFGTRVTWGIELGRLAAVYPVQRVVFIERARHGVLGIRSETRLEKPPWYADWVSTLPGGKDPLKITTQYSAPGPLVSTVTLSPFVLAGKNGLIKIGAFRLEISIDSAFTSLSLAGNWEGLSDGDGNGLGAVTLAAAHDRMTDLIWAGQGTLALESFSLSEEGTAINGFDATLAYHLSPDPARERMALGIQMEAQDMVYNDRPLSKWALALAVNHVDIRACQALAQLYYQMAGQIMTGGVEMGPGAAGKQAGGLMAQNRAGLAAGLEMLMKKDLELNISRLELSLPQGRVAGHLSLGLNQDLTMARCMMLAVQPHLALEIFSLDSQLRLPAALAGSRYHDLVAPLFPGMKTGLFVQQGQMLTHRAEIRDTRFYLNGQEVALAF